MTEETSSDIISHKHCETGKKEVKSNRDKTKIENKKSTRMQEIVDEQPVQIGTLVSISL